MKNFLYLYGPTGAGKTRLLRTMETTLAEQGASGDVVRVGAEKLVAEMVSELTVQGLDRFFDRYAEVENLLVDNCWVLARKPHATRMLAQLFGGRRESGKLTVVASDFALASVDKEIPELLDDAVVVDLKKFCRVSREHKRFDAIKVQTQDSKRGRP